MNQVNLDLFFDRLNYYQLLLFGFALVGIFGFSFLSKIQRKNEVIRTSLGILVVTVFYEFFAVFLASQKVVNLWVYNIFNSHIAAVLFLLLIRSFLKRKSHKKLVNISMMTFLFLSLILHLTGFVHFNDSGQYILFLNSVIILCCCSLYFIELITMEEYLAINPLKEFSFWAATAVLFYFSSSFMIYISYHYLYTNHLDLYYMVREIPRTMTLVCNLLLCAGIISPLLKEKFQLGFIHV